MFDGRVHTRSRGVTAEDLLKKLHILNGFDVRFFDAGGSTFMCSHADVDAGRPFGEMLTVFQDLSVIHVEGRAFQEEQPELSRTPRHGEKRNQGSVR